MDGPCGPGLGGKVHSTDGPAVRQHERTHPISELPFSAAANLTRDPELRVTDSGQSITRIGLAVTPRRYDRQTNAWRDGTPTLLDG